MRLLGAAAIAMVLAGCAVRAPPARGDAAEPNCRPVVLVICVLANCRDVRVVPPEAAPAPR